MSSSKRILSLEQMNEEVREFLYIITHDLKNPVRGIKQASDWLLADYKDKVGEEGSKLLEMLQNKAVLLSDMIDGINNFSKVNFKRESIVEIRLDKILDIIVDDINHTFSKNGDKHKLLIERNFDKNISIQGDELKFSQIFKEILVNLVQFSSADQTDVLCSIICHKEERNSYYMISVANDHILFDTTRIPKLLSPFQEITVQSKKINTMMTLTLAKKLIESYGGVLTVHSENGKGLSFSFTYPIKLAT